MIWVQCLPLAEFAGNNGKSESTRCTQFFAGRGVDPRMTFADEPTQEWDQRCVDADQVQATMQQIYEHLRVEMRRSQAVKQEGANRWHIPAPNIEVGPNVSLDTRNIQTTWPTRQLNWKRLGPFRVVQRVSAYAYEPELPMSVPIHWVQPIWLLNPVVDDPFVGQRVGPLPSVEVDGDEEYQVSSVEDSRGNRSQLQNLIRWTGYDSLTWKAERFVHGLQAAGKFHQRYSGEPGALWDIPEWPRMSGGIPWRGLVNTEVLRNIGRDLRMVWKELYYTMVEMLGDVEDAVGWWWDSLVW